MPEVRKTRVVPVREVLYCECGAELKASPDVLLSAPPQYEYWCPSCQKRFLSTELYPRVTYIDETDNLRE